MRLIGFSTGAVARSDFRRALEKLRPFHLPAIEISALRLPELVPLVTALPELDLARYDFVSFHAPSRFRPSDEEQVVEQLHAVVDRNIPVVVHPDVISRPSMWLPFGPLLFIENMDKRKAVGRKAGEMKGLFARLPEARFCFDIAHARQVDPTMVEARLLLDGCGDRLAEVHISELNTRSQHEPISLYAMSDYQSVADLIPEDVPIILETLIDEGQSDVQTEIDRALRALAPSRVLEPAHGD